MKRLTITLFFLLICPALAYSWPASVIDVIDGDTIPVAPAGARDAPMRVRLYGVDAPEHDQPGGAESTDALRGMLAGKAGKRVQVIPMDTDRYGRTVGLVIAGGQTVNAELVKMGHAWVYARYCRAYFCRQWSKEEAHARKEGVGLWGGEEREGKVEPPWEWRKKAR